VSTITSLGFNIFSNWDGAGIREARDDIDRLKRDLQTLRDQSVTVNVDVDSAAAMARIESLSEMDPTVDVKVNVDSASAISQIRSIGAQSPAVEVGVRTRGAGEAEAQIDAVARNRTADIFVDTHGAVGQLQGMNDQILKLGREGTVTKDALSRLSSTNRELEQAARNVEQAHRRQSDSLIGVTSASEKLNLAQRALQTSEMRIAQVWNDSNSTLLRRKTAMDANERASVAVGAAQRGLTNAVRDAESASLNLNNAERDRSNIARTLSTALNAVEGSTSMVSRSVGMLGSAGMGAGNMIQGGMGMAASAIGAVATAAAWTVVGVEAIGAAGAAAGAIGAVGLAAIPAAMIAWPLMFEDVRKKFEGLMDGIKDHAMWMADSMLPHLQTAFSGAFDAIHPALDRLMPRINDLIDRVGRDMIPLSEKMGLFWERGFANGAPVLDRLIQALNPVVDGFIHFSDVLSGPDMLHFIDVMGTELGRLVGILGDLTKALLPVGETFMRTFDDVLAELTPVLGDIMTEFNPLINTIGKFLVDALRDLHPFLVELARMFTELATGALNHLEPLLKPLADALTRVMIAMEPLIPPFMEFIDAWVQVGVEVLPVIADVGVELAQSLVPLLKMLADHVRDNTPLLKDLAIKIGQALLDALQKIGPYLPQFVDSWFRLVDALIPLLPKLVDLALKFEPILLKLIDLAPYLLKFMDFMLTVIEKSVQFLSFLENFGEKLGFLGKIAMGPTGIFAGIAGAFGGMFSSMLGDQQTKGGQLTADWDAHLNGKKTKSGLTWDEIRQKAAGTQDGMGQDQGAKTAQMRTSWEQWNDNNKMKHSVTSDDIRTKWQGMFTGMSTDQATHQAQIKMNWEQWNDNNKMKHSVTSDDIRTKWQGMFSGMDGDFNNGFKPKMEQNWRTHWDNQQQTAKTTQEGIHGDFETFGTKVGATLDRIVAEAGRIWGQITSHFQGPVDDIKRIWNGVAGAFGLTPLEVHATGGPVGSSSGMLKRATGGEVSGMGGGIGDRIPALLSNNEHVWTSSEVDAAGGHGAVMQLRASVMRRGNIQNDNRFAAGGPVNNWDAAVAMAREKGDGRAYVYGGSGPDGFDCSGYMSAIYNMLTGRAPWNRSFSTESNFGSLGFVNGLNSRFAIGVHNGGGGPNSHMAGTLGGVNVESGGPHNSTTYGGPSAGANHPQFEHQYSLPEVGGQFVSGGGGGGPTAEQIAMHDKAVGEIRAVIDKTNQTSASKMFGVAKSEGIPLRALDANGAKSVFGAMVYAGDTHAAGTQKSGFGAIGKLDSALAALAASSPGGEVPTGDRRALLEHALGLTHTPPPNTMENWLAGLNTLITRESGWNAGAVNNWDSNASKGGTHGLMQLLHSNFDSYHVPGTSDNIYDGLANVAAGIGYVKATYGDISNVQQANAGMPAKGYATGTSHAAPGFNVVGENGPELVNFGGGGQTVNTFDDIMTALKEGSLSTATELEQKLSADVQAFFGRLIEDMKSHNGDMRATLENEFRGLVATLSEDLQGSGKQLANQVEGAIERVLATAGINVTLPMQVPQNAADVQQYAQQVANQLLPQLEMLIRQRVGSGH
jgi:SLT domain-containing protein